MSKRAKVLHRQTFQNSNNIVELTVKTIPKDVLPIQNPVPKPSSYVRDCGVKKELKRISDKENNNNVPVFNKALTIPKKMKDNKSRVTVEVSKKVSRKHHEIVPKNSTWGNVLRNYSVTESHDESELVPVSGSRKNRVVNQCLPEQCQGWEQKSSHTTDSEQSNISELIVNRQIQSETPSQEFVSQHVYNGNHQNAVPRRRSSSSSGNSTRRKHPRGEKSAKTLLKKIDVDQQAVPVMQPDQNLQQVKGPGNTRLLSDDATPSPFGASALQLLHRLRERLQSRGDSEGMDIVGVVEAYIAGQGSNGAVGASNVLQSLIAVSSGCSPVFPVPINNPITSGNIPSSLGKVSVPNNTEAPKSSQLPDQPTKPKHFRFDTDIKNQGNTESHRQVPGSVMTNHNQHFQAMHFPHEENTHTNLNMPANETDAPQKDCQGKQLSKDDLIREIERQKNLVARQESDILQLRTLSTRLIARQEQLTFQNQEMDRNCGGGTQAVRQTQNQECQTEANYAERPTRDWESSTPASDRDYRSTILLLQTENNSLRKEVKRLREITMDLQNQLTKAYADLDSERRSHSRLSGLLSSKLSGSAPNLDIVDRHLRGNVPGESVPIKPLSNHGESEVDSAYEEKTSSRVTSKVGSPHSDAQDNQETRYDKSVHPSTLNGKNVPLQQRNQRSNVDYYSSNQHLRDAQGLSRETTIPSITRDVSISSEQMPVYQSAFPSIEILNSNSVSRKGDFSKQNLNSYEIQRFHSMANAQNQNVCGDNETQRFPSNAQNQGFPIRTNNPCSKTSNRRNDTLMNNMSSSSITDINNISSDIAVLLNNIEYKEGQVKDDPVYPSFSTVSDESQNEEPSHEGREFLQGIPFRRSTTEKKDTEKKSTSGSEIIRFVKEMQNPTMESTRVQEVSPCVSGRNDSNIRLLTMQAMNTLKSNVSDIVEEL